jgi:hypothetical protein
MPSTKFQKQVKHMARLEEKARNLANRLYEVQRAWEDLRTEAFLASPEYLEFCNQTGVVTDYNFRDLLA